MFGGQIARTLTVIALSVVLSSWRAQENDVVMSRIKVTRQIGGAVDKTRPCQGIDITVRGRKNSSDDILTTGHPTSTLCVLVK